MKLTVHLGENSYPIYIENHILDHAASYIAETFSGRRIMIISDDQVYPLYGSRLKAQLEKHYECFHLVLPHGEATKSFQNLPVLYGAMLDAGISRSDLVIALGGGVIGDLAGFAAASYLRGVRLIQIPTSLLAQVDSSVGGKVAVDLPQGKNLAGAFYQPSLVLIDPTVLNTLAPHFVSDGMGEVIKYGCIHDEELFALLEALDDETISGHWEDIIGRCCEAKGRIVERDVLDLGERMLLNFGHTIGHAIERCYGYGYYTHGEGVAAGMAMLTGVTEHMGLTEAGTTERLCKVLRRYGLPTDVQASADDLLRYIGNDKKKRGNRMTLIILKAIGQSDLRISKPFGLPR